MVLFVGSLLCAVQLLDKPSKPGRRDLQGGETIDIEECDHEEGCRLRVVGGQGLCGELAGGNTIIGSCVTQLKY